MISTPILFYLVNLFFGLVELLLALRVILRLFGASSSAPFVEWVYQTSAPLISPFVGMFPHPAISNGFILEFSTLFALVAYGIVNYLIIEFLGMAQHANHESSKRKH